MTVDAIGRELRLDVVRAGEPRTLTAVPSELAD
jgi:hypothetical protein